MSADHGDPRRGPRPRRTRAEHFPNASPDNVPPAPSAPRDLPHEATERDERNMRELLQGEGGAVFRLMLDYNRERLDPEDPASAAFYDWYARWARENRSAEERAARRSDTEAFVQRIRQRLEAQAMAGRSRVREVAGIPYATAGAAMSLASGGHRTTVALYDLAVAAGPGRDLWDEPSVGHVALPDDLSNTAAYVALRVAGDSMRPLLEPGDVMLVHLGATLDRGTVVVARHPENGYVVKQVGSVTNERIELTSINAAYAPVFIPHDTALVLGTVELRWRSRD